MSPRANVSNHHSRTKTHPYTTRCARLGLLTFALIYPGTKLFAQGAQSPDSTPMMKVSPDAYIVHQSIDFGGRIVDHSGSDPMWATLVNESSGPRLLGHTLQMHAKDHYAPRLLFDDLSMNSFGFGGDPNNFVSLRMSKGRLYLFNGRFRRDRNYFDYDLLSNPLIPTTSNPYLPALSSPHLSNSVRRMTDTDVTFLPMSRFAVRLGYSSNIWQGPSFSTIHVGADAQLIQSLRNSTENYTIGVDWKILPKTLLSYDQYIIHYKGDTTWTLTGLNYQLSNGTPVSIGIDIFTANNSPCAVPIINSTTTPQTISPTCKAFLAYNRTAPTRGLAPTEQLRLVSSSIDRVQMTGRFAYSHTNNNVPQYSEFFDGLNGATRQLSDTGNAAVKRINVTAEGAATAELTDKFSVTDSIQFTNFRIPGNTTDTLLTKFGSSMLTPPNTFSPATCPPPYTAATCPVHTTSSAADLITTHSSYFLQQKSTTNTILLSYQPVVHGGVQVGYRYRDRTIIDAQNLDIFSTYYPKIALRGACATGVLLADGTCKAETTSTGGDEIPIHEHWGLFGAWLQPSEKFRINLNTDFMYADNAFTRISPRQLQRYRVRATYRPQRWLNIAGTVNILEKRNNVSDAHNLQHSRDYSISAMVTKSDRWSFDLSYSYDNIFSTTDICYVSSVAPSTTPACPSNPAPYILGTSYYSEPTNFGTANFMLHPVERVTAYLGYTVSDVSGLSTVLNPRQVPGSLQSRYQTPYGRLAVTLMPRLTWNGEWRFKEYNENSPVGPTAPRDFRGNLYTLNLRYSY